MKKLFYAVAFAAFISMSFTSCRKCEICTKESSPEVRVCEGDYGSKTEYGLAIDGYELLGYDCR